MKIKVKLIQEIQIMIDKFSPYWKKACELINYTYPEDLDSWKCPENGTINISSPVMEKLSLGDVVCINSINYSYFFIFSMLSSAILDYTPLALLSTSKNVHVYQNRMLFYYLNGEFESDEKVIERLSAVAMEYGLSLIVITNASLLPKKRNGLTTLKVRQVRNRLILTPPEEVTVTVNREKQYRFHIDNDSRITAGLSIKGRNVLLVMKDERS